METLDAVGQMAWKYTGSPNTLEVLGSRPLSRDMADPYVVYYA